MQGRLGVSEHLSSPGILWSSISYAVDNDHLRRIRNAYSAVQRIAPSVP